MNGRYTRCKHYFGLREEDEKNRKLSIILAFFTDYISFELSQAVQEARREVAEEILGKLITEVQKPIIETAYETQRNINTINTVRKNIIRLKAKYLSSDT